MQSGVKMLIHSNIKNGICPLFVVYQGDETRCETLELYYLVDFFSENLYIYEIIFLPL
jgi:hypothetical protein